MALSKGEKTRRRIIATANRLFNKEERLLGLNELASAMDESRSLITNHFPRKELLNLAIYEQYEKDLAAIASSHGSESFQDWFALFSDVLDLIHEYRFALSYILLNPLKDRNLSEHIEKTYEMSRDNIRQRIEAMVHTGLLEERILNRENYDIFLFQYTNLSITWIISLKIYDKDAAYKDRKPVYIKGIMNCMEPYLTKAGRSDFEQGLAAI